MNSLGNPALIWGRVLMADTLAFHIFFALFGVGIPLLVCLAELVGLLRKNTHYMQIARRWSFAMTVLFVVGAISGTIVAVEFFLLWPGFVAFAGSAIGLPMFLEVFAFFIEAIFLGIYLYTWDRWGSSWQHWLCSLPVVVGSLASAFLITTVNAFMNDPSGITVSTVNGVSKITSVSPWHAMFGPAVFTETSHSILAYYATTFFVAAAVYALALMRRRKKQHTAMPEDSTHYLGKALAFCLTLAFIFSLFLGMTGDQSARFLVTHEPLKLAAIEQLPTTQANAPVVIFGVHVPGLLSILAGGTKATVVRGLADFNPALWPPAFIHWLFDVMAISGVLLVLVPIVYACIPRWRHSLPILWLIIVASFGAIFSVEAGWIVTEVGRQPFVVAGLLLTADAFTTSTGVVTIALIFPVLYLVLAVAVFWILIRHYVYKSPL